MDLGMMVEVQKTKKAKGITKVLKSKSILVLASPATVRRNIKRSLPFGISLHLMLLIAIQRIISPSRNRKPKEKNKCPIDGEKQDQCKAWQKFTRNCNLYYVTTEAITANRKKHPKRRKQDSNSCPVFLTARDAFDLQCFLDWLHSGVKHPLSRGPNPVHRSCQFCQHSFGSLRISSRC